MIAVDTNVLIYAHRGEMDRHAAALESLEALVEGDEPWALPVFVINEFVRVATHPRVLDRPSSRAVAIDTIDALLASPTARLLTPGPRFWPLLCACLDEANVQGNGVLDAAIVAVCREHGVDTLLSADRGFRRFDSIKLQLL